MEYFQTRQVGIVDRRQRKIRFVFDSTKVDTSDPAIASWLKSVESGIGLKPFNPEPYWGFDDLRDLMGEEARNCF